VVKMAPYADSIAPEVRALLARSEEGIKSGMVQPFYGEIRDQAGTVRVRAGTGLSEADIRSINWLVAGMQGRLKG
jgi:basic membrane protein A and related proteins